MIRIKDLRMYFGRHKVLDGINLEIGRGETVVVLGRSGVGKSVLLKCIVGLLKPTSGEVWVEDVRVDTASWDVLSRLRKKFGYVFQGAALFDWMTVLENVMLPLREMGVEYEEAKRRAIQSLNHVGLKGSYGKYPSELSGGMRKRVGIARAIVVNPAYLFYDEPTSGLDPQTSRMIYDLMQTLDEELDATTVIISHDVVLAKRFGRRVVYLDDGRIEYDGPFEHAHRSPKFMEFLGEHVHLL
ncbi:MAG: ATP-binding cassette domain-containing protein [Thermotogae bacterium]|nr:ATP-binding cassette domain-containing protein [Thermotogota bacterium]